MRFLFKSHEDCLKKTLLEISLKYRGKKKFLDLGCGRGDRTICFEGFDRILYGVDRVDTRLDSVCSRVIFTREDFAKNQIGYRDGNFDFIFSFDVIEHLPEPDLFLKEAQRLLDKNGIFVISTPNRHRFFGFILIALGLRKFPYGAMDKEGVVQESYDVHLREYTDKELKKLLEKVGFKVVKTHRIFYGLTGRWGFKEFFNWPFCHNLIIECVKS